MKTPPIKFSCPDCGQHLSAEKELFGTSLECPACTATILVPSDCSSPEVIDDARRSSNEDSETLNHPSESTSNTEVKSAFINHSHNYCASCGTESETSAKFCGKCGRPLNAGAAEVGKNCTDCGCQLPTGSLYCPSCGKLGSTEYPSEKIERVAVLPERIRDKLRNYQRVEEITCRECGYVGLMGIVKHHVPWYYSWWILIPLLLTGVGTVVAILLGIGRAMSTRTEADCPNCDTRVITDS